MVYIFMAAGKGTRLHPLTLNKPKVLYKLDKDNTVLQRMVRLIKKYDNDAKIIVVLGFMSEAIKEELASYDVTFVMNPFYEVTNSIASLWFARDYLTEDNVVLLDADIVMENRLIKELLCKPVDRPKVLLDSSIKRNGDYNVQVNHDKVVVMSKNLDDYYGEYAGITLLNPASAIALKEKIEVMLNDGFYDQWYEDALVQMIFDEDFELYYDDICDSKWTEVDCVSDMLLAKKINEDSNY